jgi:hypothetical protein
MPSNVLNRGLLSWIKSYTAALLDENAVQQANSRLDQLSLSTDRKVAARQHVESLQAREA